PLPPPAADDAPAIDLRPPRDHKRPESVTVNTSDILTAQHEAGIIVPAAPKARLGGDEKKEKGPSDAPPRAAVRSAIGDDIGVVVLRPVDVRRFLADAIARRLTGALCFEHDRVVRRLVVRDGDLVTAASGAESETLVCFLGARGELPRDEVDRLS